MTNERDYVLGTHDEELERLGLQHRAWQSVALDCWRRAGITAGSRVLDVGAGPGYATVDLAEIVGSAGEVVALERSHKFVAAIEKARRTRSLTNVKIKELDLMTDELPQGQFDFSWCRWVLCFVSDPALLVKKIGSVLKRGGLALFHEYGHYKTWRFAPRRPSLEEFRTHVIETWRAAGGEPDTGRELPSWLATNGFAVRSVRPHVFCLRPNDFMWKWPAQFIEVHLSRLKELGRIDDGFAEKVRAELTDAENNPNSFMITPLVLEIVAERL